VRILGVTSLEKSPLFPDLPPVAQSGAPGYEYQLWWGLFGPGGMPAELVAVINAAVNKVLAGPEMKKFFALQGTDIWAQSPAQIADLLPKEIARYRKAMEVAGISPQK
jgi:tripartite-type tricarboxylate transporter receptor subunit TctC